MTPEERDRLTRVEQQMADTRTDITEIKADLKVIVATLSEAKGGWRTLMAVAAVAGATGAFLHKATAILGLVK